ncbi:MAG: YifB family Mg chelatase-like AAA ATPase [Lachnospiraceae bacterium]|nr:YifB family Mg chelatase-like AAA ATPase [Lachnospiraceae bacterium]
MFNKVSSSAVMGIDGVVIQVEADVSDGLPMFSMVGCLSPSVREAGERVRTALKNSDFYLPPKRITVNLSPGNIKKYGTGFDLPIAVAILLCMGITPEENVRLDKTLIIGELGLNGMVKPVNGILPMIYDCHELGYDTCIVPCENMKEAALVEGMKVFGVESLKQAVDFITGISSMESYKFGYEYDILQKGKLDFSEIKGQESIKRGMEIAAAGFHNVLMAGAAGAGKSMIAKRLPTIMPKMTFEESVQVTKIYSINGMLNSGRGLICDRPFRSPHHTITGRALIGGGVNPRPGEVSMAHNGVLFLDEMPEFNKNVLEVLRQPIEDRKVSLSRVNASYVFPSDFMLVAAMNIATTKLIQCGIAEMPENKAFHGFCGFIFSFFKPFFLLREQLRFLILHHFLTIAGIVKRYKLSKLRTVYSDCSDCIIAGNLLFLCSQTLVGHCNVILSHL